MTAADVAIVDVAIVGGGFTGAVFAIHLLRMAERPLDIAIVEPRGRSGGGVAYDTADPDHRLNAPLPVHFVYPDAPDHLDGWYAERGGPARDPEAQAATSTSGAGISGAMSMSSFAPISAPTRPARISGISGRAPWRRTERPMATGSLWIAGRRCPPD